MATRNLGRDRAGHVDPFYQRRKRFEPVLRAVGVAELFAAMPRKMQELFWRLKTPAPVMEFDATFPAGREYRSVRTDAEAGFRKAKITINRHDLAASDFFEILGGMVTAIKLCPWSGREPDAVKRFVREGGDAIERCYTEHLQSAVSASYMGVRVPLCTHSRLDRILFTMRSERAFAANGKSIFKVIVGAVKAQERTVRVGNGPRRAVCVPEYCVADQIKWLDVDTAALGLSGPARRVPVYVQHHALRRLAQRVDVPSLAPYAQSWLSDALGDPRVVARDGADLLVEFRMENRRLGYLIVTPTTDAVVVRTFKFLTMEGMPEARLLKKRLGLTRLDVDWLRLSKLASYTQTDLADDPKLRPLFDACGCGHLFELAESEGNFAPAAAPAPLAAEVHKYLGLAA
jgi:hypothetical protein